MDEKMTMPKLAQYFALQSGLTQAQAEEFIKEFFNIIIDNLSAGEMVKIKDLGIFKVVTVSARKSVDVSTGEETVIPEHRKVVFMPSKEVASLVNEPFEMFETIELSEDADLDSLEQPASFSVSDEDSRDETPLSEGAAIEESNVEESPLEESNDEESTLEEFPQEEFEPEDSQSEDLQPEDSQSEDSMPEDSESGIALYVIDAVHDVPSDTPIVEAPKPVMPLESSPIRVYNEPKGYDDHDSDEEMSTRKKTKFMAGFLSGFIVSVILCGLTFIAIYYIDWDTLSFKPKGVNAATVNTEEGEIEDALALDPLANDSTIAAAHAGKQEEAAENSVATQPSDSIVYDQISTTRYLTTMAKDHYGNFNLWPYIYIENQSFLGHPDRIKPGTKVVIPPLSKYGVDPNNPEDIAKAKKKGVEIYSRYK